MSRQFIDSRRSWRLRGRAQDYEIVRGFGLSEEPDERVAASQVVAELDRWVGSVFSQRILDELYESVTGRPPEPSRGGRGGGLERGRELKRRLTEAFREGALLALPASPARVKKWPEAAPSSAPSPLEEVPRVEEAPESAPEPEEAEAEAEAEEEPQSTARPEEAEEEQQSTAWVEFELVDSEGEPLTGVRYRLTLADGSTREGEVDASGVVRVEGIEPGECTVVFPELDAS